MYTGTLILHGDFPNNYAIVSFHSPDTLEVMDDNTHTLSALIGRKVEYEMLESMPPKATNVRLHTPQAVPKVTVNAGYTRDKVKEIVHAWNVYLDETPWDNESSAPSFDEWFDKHY